MTVGATMILYRMSSDFMPVLQDLIP